MEPLPTAGRCRPPCFGDPSDVYSQGLGRRGVGATGPKSGSPIWIKAHLRRVNPLVCIQLKMVLRVLINPFGALKGA